MDKLIILDEYKKSHKLSEEDSLLIKRVLGEYASFIRLLNRQLGKKGYTGRIEEHPAGEKEMMKLLSEEEKRDLENLAYDVERIYKNLKRKLL